MRFFCCPPITSARGAAAGNAVTSALKDSGTGPSPMVCHRHAGRPKGTTPQDRPGRTPRPLRPPATKKVDFSSYTSGQHLRPGLVTLNRAHPERVPQARTQYWVVNPEVESLPRQVTISPQKPVFLGREPSGTGAHCAPTTRLHVARKRHLRMS